MTAPGPGEPVAGFPAPLLLASASPRRRELLAALGVAFAVLPADMDERSDERDPAALAEALALRKLHAVAARPEAAGRAVLAADTIVVLDGRVLGKPTDAAEARAMLAALRGRAHAVITAVAASAGARSAVACVTATVTMRAYTDAEVERAIASGEPFDKAGAYAI